MDVPSCVEVIQTKTALEFVELLRPSNSRWKQVGDTRWVFRGHANSNWELKASAHRVDGLKILDPLVRQFADQTPEWSYQRHQEALDTPSLLITDEPSRHKVLSVMSKAQSRAISDFATLANELGLRIGDDDEWADDGQRFSCYDLQPTLTHALAQHHGIPTGLLDWSRNPL